MARTLLERNRFSGKSFRKKKRHQQLPLSEHPAGYYGSMLHSRAISHRLYRGKEMSSNCPIYVQPQALSYYYPLDFTLQALPWHLHPHRWVLGCTDDSVCGTQTTNNRFNQAFFLLENTRGSQCGTPKIKGLSINPTGSTVPRVLQDFCYLAGKQSHLNCYR